MSAAAADNAYASQAAADAGGLKEPAVNGEISKKADTQHSKQYFEQLQAKYAAERNKRIRADAKSQYINLDVSEKFKHLADDPWIELDQNSRLELQHGMHTKVFIIGGGFGGIQYAVRMVENGIKPKDIIIADTAGGFGGTWYWNRYPGLMCDVESYIYMPLLEETGYIPKHRYSYGPEIREYTNLITRHWGLENRGAFQQSVTNLDWNDTENHWHIKSVDLAIDKPVHLTADFVVVAPGLLHRPKVSNFKGIDDFKGHLFHTARWDYEYTGGSPTDSSLTKLKDKRVGIIGTGATAVQVVPQLSKWAKEVYVIQRTPSGVDQRGQRPTDPDTFSKQVSTEKGWQWKRTENFNSFLNNVDPLPEKNLVNDAWSKYVAYSALLGSPKLVDQKSVPGYVASMHAMDAPRQESIRKRIDEVVNDPETAEKLKPWYPGWCKRPCFHDDYLPAFNSPHVHLVDTDGKGVDRITASGLIANNTEYTVDCIIFSTGYGVDARASPTGRAGISTHGRNGRSLDTKWSENVATLHGVATHDFPNLFLCGFTQSASSANFSSALGQLAIHAAHIVSQAYKTTGADRVVIEPTPEAEEEWSTRIMAGAIVFASIAGCTPSYINGEGEADQMPMEQRMKAARSGTWGRGMNDFVSVLQHWRDDGGLKGLRITAV